ncbi:hypothetical protein SF23_00245 [Streptomyces sp. MBRL 10]|nr:hypothetical protein SF23_00245 [Streptomyces sp. MBRL 10]
MPELEPGLEDLSEVLLPHRALCMLQHAQQGGLEGMDRLLRCGAGMVPAGDADPCHPRGPGDEIVQVSLPYSSIGMVGQRPAGRGTLGFPVGQVLAHQPGDTAPKLAPRRLLRLVDEIVLDRREIHTFQRSIVRGERKAACDELLSFPFAGQHRQDHLIGSVIAPLHVPLGRWKAVGAANLVN